MFISATFIATLVRFVNTSLVCENKNNGDKLHCRKFMRAADEKVIINELGPCLVRELVNNHNRCELFTCD